MDDRDGDFGFRRIPLGEKQQLVNDVFHTVAGRYDLMNDMMSAGLHRVWKNIFVQKLAPPKGEIAYALLDVAGGTGDIAFRVLAKAGSKSSATLLDINSDMLDVGRARARDLGLSDRVRFVEANAERLPLADRSFDAYTIAFGIRNVPRIEAALSEAYRVLRIGGRFMCLEFSSVDVPGLDALYDFYSFNVVPALGRAVVGDAEPYRYLVESIRRFPKPDRFSDMIRDAGFRRVACEPLSGGIVALHSGWRL